MQIAACPDVLVVKYSDFAEELIEAERQSEMKAEDLQSKPDAIKTKIVNGRVEKTFKTKVLLEQSYIKDPSMNVDEFIKSYTAVLGENIQVSRFIRFNLGETIAEEEEEEVVA